MNTPSETPQREMRLTMRVLGHWRDIADVRDLPRRAEIDPSKIGEDWASCLMIEVDAVFDQSRFLYIGKSLLSPDANFTGRAIAECPKNTILRSATEYIGRVIARRVPISVGGTSTHLGKPILFRSVLMPLSEDGNTIDGLLGAANFREVRASEDTHPAEPA
jgi:hypothetical protein